MSRESLDTDEQLYAIKSWRYLRLAMVALVVGLFVSIGYEVASAPENCFQTSISAYYYTPVHDFFVAALLAIGVCLFCLRGCTDVEDGVLNLAGMFAPVVALVPTPKCGECASVFVSLQNRTANIENNVTALIVVGALAGVVLAILTGRKKIEPPGDALKMFAVAVGVWTCLIYGLWGMDDAVFEENAHYAAAIPMFVCILIVVFINARGYHKKKKAAAATKAAEVTKATAANRAAAAKQAAKATKAAKPVLNPYAYVGVAMIASSLIIGLAAVFLSWDYWVIGIETALIVLFAVFWVIQTIELWDDGLWPPVRSPETTNVSV